MSDIPGGDSPRKKPRRKASRARDRAEASVAGLERRLHGEQEAPPPPPGPKPSVAERVEYCMLLMVKGLWNGYATRQTLMEAWGISDVSVRAHSAEASRRLRLDQNELEAARVSHAFFCERIQREALAMCNEITGLPDFASALKATELAARFKGIDIDAPAQHGDGAPQRIEIKVLPPDEPPEEPS
jgi:hypothetical protein